MELFAGSRLVLEKNNSLLRILLIRPPGNEMDQIFFRELKNILEDILPDTRAEGLVIQGHGRHFSSGADIDELKKEIKNQQEAQNSNNFFLSNIRSFAVLERLTFPSAALISGCCLGSGLELALACNFRLASKSAVFSLPEIMFRLIPGCGGLVRLAKLAGREKAAELVLSGRTFDTEEALKYGIIDAVYEKNQLEEKFLEILKFHGKIKRQHHESIVD
ncbi:MAG TPA: hypothetical protein DC049_08675 [Spirochaetia bacterium]|nr:hypothetical protein [Spirochaetia bacterium]